MRSPPRLPRWTSIALAGLMCTPTLACSDADGRAYQGTIATAILPDDASRSMVIVQLDGNDSGDSNRVRITFPTTELSCRDGSEVKPETVAVGSEIEFIRVGNDSDTTLPLTVGARRVQVSC